MDSLIKSARLLIGGLGIVPGSFFVRITDISPGCNTPYIINRLLDFIKIVTRFTVNFIFHVSKEKLHRTRYPNSFLDETSTDPCLGPLLSFGI